MRILLTFDTGYAPHAATVMESIIQNCPEKLDFVVIYYDLNKETKDVLSKHFEKKVKSLEFVKLDESVLKNTIKDVKTAPHLSGFNTYLRLFSAQLLPNDKHIIYLDCDVLVQDNILKILDGADLSKPICAVTDYNPAYKLRDLTMLAPIEECSAPWIYEAYWYRAFSDLELSPTTKCFGAGIMIINLDYWREYKIAEKALAFLLEHPEKAFAADQDALNYVVKGNYHELDPRWNAIGLAHIFTNYSVEKLEQTKNNPAIIHVGGDLKPWKYDCAPNHQKLYWKYRQSTPWSKIEYKDKTIKKVIKKRIVSPIKFVVKSIIKPILNQLHLEVSTTKTENVWSKSRIRN
ncbi:glycosyl transferase family protein [Candidatus Symbiothrix dinenymphae]|nr:glycosyl transferase family protein [Candidatus Symbiothrix dinenymphae]